MGRVRSEFKPSSSRSEAQAFSHSDQAVKGDYSLPEGTVLPVSSQKSSDSAQVFRAISCLSKKRKRVKIKECFTMSPSNQLLTQILFCTKDIPLRQHLSENLVCSVTEGSKVDNSD